MNTAASTTTSTPDTLSNTPADAVTEDRHEYTEALHGLLMEQLHDAYDAMQRGERNIRSWAVRPLPAPMVYDLLADLKSLGHVLGHIVGRLAAGLDASHDAYDLFNDDGTDPADVLTVALNALTAGVVHANQTGRALDDAQAALSVQGYRITKPSRATQPAHDDENGDLS